MTELKPCPFCGSDKVVIAYVCGDHCAQCEGCEGQGGWYDSEAKAAAAWNTRAPCPECDRQRERANEAVSRADTAQHSLEARFALQSDLARLLGCEGLEGDEQLRVAVAKAQALEAVLDAALSEWDAYATNDVTHGQINRAMRNLHEALYRAAPKHFDEEPLRVTPECPGCLKLRERNARLEASLRAIAYHPYCNYENSEASSYGTGVVDGHRCAASIALAALGATPNTAQDWAK